MKKIILALTVLFSLQLNAQNILIDTANLVVRSLGSTGTGIASPINDTLYIRKIVAGNRITIDTLPTREIRVRVSADLQEVTDHANATDNIYIYTPENRMYYVSNGYAYSVAITDSITFAGYDTDAEIYMDAVETAGRTLSGTEKARINNLFVGLKADGIYTLLIDGIIPIWGSAAPSMIPLKATHTFTAAGSPNFLSTGIDFNGSGQYVITSIIPATHLSTGNGSMFYYSQDNVTETNVDIGVSTGTNRFELLSKSTGPVILARAYNASTGQVSATTTSSQGFSGVVRASTSDLRAFKDGAQLGSTNTTASGYGSSPTNAIYIGARNSEGTAGLYSTKKCSAAFVLQGMTTTQVANFTTRVETFMDAMGIGVIP